MTKSEAWIDHQEGNDLPMSDVFARGSANAAPNEISGSIAPSPTRHAI